MERHTFLTLALCLCAKALNNQTEDTETNGESMGTYMGVAAVPLIIIVLAVTVAVLSWSYNDRCFISIFLVLMAVVNLFFAFIHMFAWNSPIMMSAPFFLLSAALGLLLQIAVGIARCFTSCHENEKCGLGVGYSILIVAILTALATLPILYFWGQYFVSLPSHSDASSKFMSALLFLAILSVQVSLVASYVFQWRGNKQLLAEHRLPQ